jgi:hypothetical protein
MLVFLTSAADADGDKVLQCEDNHIGRECANEDQTFDFLQVSQEVPQRSTTNTTRTTDPCSASVTDDPHIANLRGERFDINQPGDYLMFRMPQNRANPALIELQSAMSFDEGSSCGLYMRLVTLTGDWLQGKKVEIRAHQRNFAGSNTDGNATVASFAVKVSAPLASSANAELWRPFPNFTAGATGVEALTDKVTVAQASHQALNIELVRVGQLGSEFGGLLGTEAHDKKIEELTQECREAKTPNRHPDGADYVAPVLATETFRAVSCEQRAVFTASWD